MQHCLITTASYHQDCDFLKKNLSRNFENLNFGLGHLSPCIDVVLVVCICDCASRLLYSLGLSIKLENTSLK